MMNTAKWFSRHINIMIRVAAVIILAIAVLPAAPLSQASASSAPSGIPANAVATSTPLVTQIVAGGTHSCALTPEGGVVCWGMNFLGSSATAPPTTAQCRWRFKG